jgi:DNA-binding XRE family transcriptional regulator
MLSMPATGHGSTRGRLRGTVPEGEEAPEMSDRQRSIQGVLRQARWSTGLTQEELATKCGVSVRTISDIERGHVIRPRATTLRQLAIGLSMTDEDTRRLLLLGRIGQGAEVSRLVPAEA